MIFFTDENIPVKASYILGNFESKYQVRAYLDYFKPGTPDTEWMPKVASWDVNETTTVISGDGRILRNEVEKQILKECNLMFVYLSSGWTHVKWSDYAWKIVKAWPDIVRNVEQARFPMVFQVSVGNLQIQTIGRIRNL